MNKTNEKKAPKIVKGKRQQTSAEPCLPVLGG